MEDPRIISALFIFLKMAYYNVLINTQRVRYLSANQTSKLGFLRLSVLSFPPVPLLPA